MLAATAIAKKDIPLWDKKELKHTIPEGSQITITKGRCEKFALWSGYGIFDLPDEYVDEFSVNIFSKE